MKEIELIDKRKAREKHFLTENGDIVAKMYDDDIHYLRDGKYEEIDNTLVLENGYYMNKYNDYKVSFASELTPNIMKIEKDNHYINNISKEKSNSKIISEIKYLDVLENIDISYNVMSSKVKENIFIKDIHSQINELLFNIETDLDLIINEDNSLSALFEKNVIFNIEAPFMMDVLGNINRNITYNLIKDGDIYQLFMSFDEEWLKNKAEYPVIIDPTITNKSNENNVYDTYIYPGDGNINRNNHEYLKAGVEKVNGNDIINRSLLKFDLPTIGICSIILIIQIHINITS